MGSKLNRCEQRKCRQLLNNGKTHDTLSLINFKLLCGCNINFGCLKKWLFIINPRGLNVILRLNWNSWCVWTHLEIFQEPVVVIYNN